MAEPFDIRAALVAAMAYSASPMVLTDPALPGNPLVVVNDAFTRVSGYDREECLGRNCRFMQGPGTDEQTARRIGIHLARGQGCIEWIVNHRKNGSMFWNMLFISPVYDHDGRLLGHFGNQLDISNGVPAWLGDVRIGAAHMPDEVGQQFNLLLAEALAQDSADDASQSLEALVMTARKLTVLSTRLVPVPPQNELTWGTSSPPA
jgi:PAS domain S-box-containing protein